MKTPSRHISEATEGASGNRLIGNQSAGARRMARSLFDKNDRMPSLYTGHQCEAGGMKGQQICDQCIVNSVFVYGLTVRARAGLRLVSQGLRRDVPTA